MYISPNNSSYSFKSEDIFDILEADVAKYSQLGKCILLGDFNATSGTAPDHCSYDDITKHIKIHFSYISDTPVPRNNTDMGKGCLTSVNLVVCV